MKITSSKLYKYFKNKKGYTTLEYVIGALIILGAVVVAANLLRTFIIDQAEQITDLGQ